MCLVILHPARDFVARHEGVIAEVISDFARGAPGRLASAMFMRLRLGFPTRPQQQLIHRAFAEAAARPVIAHALLKARPAAEETQ